MSDFTVFLGNMAWIFSALNILKKIDDSHDIVSWLFKQILPPYTGQKKYSNICSHDTLQLIAGSSTVHLCSMLVFYPLHQSHSGRQSRDISKCSCDLADYRLARSKDINETVWSNATKQFIFQSYSKLLSKGF